jgi:hypothetical protein
MPDNIEQGTGGQQSLASLNGAPAGEGGTPPSVAGGEGTPPPAGAQDQQQEWSGPDWVYEQFRRHENPVEAQAQAYAEALRRLNTKTDDLRNELRPQIEEELRGSIPRPPESHDAYQLPDGITADEERLTPFQQRAHELGMTQEQFAGMAELYAEINTPDIEAERAKLGENVETRIREVEAWGVKAIPPELHQTAMAVMQTADGFKLIEALMRGQQPNGVLPNAETLTPPEKPTREKLAQMQADPRYADARRRDPTYVQKVEQYAASLAEWRARQAGQPG